MSNIKDTTSSNLCNGIEKRKMDLITFMKKPCDNKLPFAPDDKILYFRLRRFPDGGGISSRSFNVWIVKKIAPGFSNLGMFEPPIKSEKSDNNDLLSNTLSWIGISNLWIFKEKRWITKIWNGGLLCLIIIWKLH